MGCDRFKAAANHRNGVKSIDPTCLPPGILDPNRYAPSRPAILPIRNPSIESTPQLLNTQPTMKVNAFFKKASSAKPAAKKAAAKSSPKVGRVMDMRADLGLDKGSWGRGEAVLCRGARCAAQQNSVISLVPAVRAGPASPAAPHSVDPLILAAP